MRKDRSLHIRIEEELLRSAQREAAKRERSLGHFIRQILRDALSRPIKQSRPAGVK